jgi:hypothetical protein
VTRGGGSGGVFPPILDLTLSCDRIPMSEFEGLLQTGFSIRTPVGVSLSALLLNAFGLEAEYVADRIKTIFLDGRPVDDLERTIVRDGSTVSLSAAMPGLVGATMRRGGILAPLRSNISHRETGSPAPAGEGTVLVKLFNLVMADLGGRFLTRGVVVPAPQLREHFARWPGALRNHCLRIVLEGRTVTTAQLSAALGATTGDVRLTIHKV